ncbi:Os03g0149400 [Oryza sativa Japonica Group]|uniref:Os03g0149400 protein n=2 Tax=Oryza sativa subsp. japonica TaxID=39947 RepID=Q0DV51_ORYSJ|nr:hypothetical protein EE612_015330 [Oryza sativa]BAF10887.1 Os03g0149400 [Oryza sativa Japonica Group]BAS82308.1 Os03g0149400 [Oryza sativa Japonica Group]|eukprot:NP_001048973.1 Os03g0149400 [Oryza sativa Japonica Group]
MRRLPKSLLLASLSKPFLRRNREPLPLLRPPPRPLPRVLPFAARTLAAPAAPPPEAAPAAQSDGFALLEAAQLREAADDHQEALALAIKALEPLQASHGGWSLPVARTLRLAASDLMRAMELKAVFLEKGSLELGNAYKDVAEAYRGVLACDKALPLCLEALEIARNHFGGDSQEVAKVRQLLATIYAGSGRNEEALEQYEIVRMVYERLGLDVELSLAETDVAMVLVLLGRSEEAMDVLKRVINRAGKESEERALAFVAMANILCIQDRKADSKRCLEIAREILDTKISVSPLQVAQVYAEMSMLYETMIEFEVALCLMKKTLVFLDGVSEMQHIQGSISARMGWLLLKTERVDEAVPYLQSAIEKLKNCFGPLHFGLGFAYKHLGDAYLAMNQSESAIKYFTIAKDIINATYGPKHEDTIDTIQSIANAYGVMGSYKQAMDYQEQVIDAYESCGPGAFEELREAQRLRYQLKIKARGLPHACFPANSLPTKFQDRE